MTRRKDLLAAVEAFRDALKACDQWVVLRKNLIRLSVIDFLIYGCGPWDHDFKYRAAVRTHPTTNTSASKRSDTVVSGSPSLGDVTRHAIPCLSEHLGFWISYPSGSVRRFLSVHGAILNLFNLGRHHLSSANHRLLRERSLTFTRTTSLIST